MDREAWILTAFAVLFLTAITVSVCGWLLVWRTRHRADEPATHEEPAPYLPPANPLR